MRRLYLQVYLTIVASLVLVVLAAGLTWHLLAGVPPFGQPFEIAREADRRAGSRRRSAPPQVQQQVIDRLASESRCRPGSVRPQQRAAGGCGPPAAGSEAAPADGCEPRPVPLFRSRFRTDDGSSCACRRGSVRAGSSLAAFLGAIALAVALGAWPIVRRLTRRLERLQHGVESLGAGDLAARVKVEGRDEVARLAQSFNQAAARIENLVGAHKLLLANASHELRTPLTRIRLGLELVEAQPERKAELEKDIAELDQLVDEILLVSRLDAADQLDVREDIDLAALAAEECARYDDCSVEGKSVTVRGDPMLLRRMIRNLVENADLHGKPPIEVSVERRGDQAVLRVSDRGSVIAEEARERLFSPFYRIPGRSGSKGTGLGLALVRQIARRHGGDVSYEPAQGSCFTVTLPAST